jgi:hypothetical protein
MDVHNLRNRIHSFVCKIQNKARTLLHAFIDLSKFQRVQFQSTYVGLSHVNEEQSCNKVVEGVAQNSEQF